MRDLETVEAEIARTKEALENVKGTETEVYARIVGYYRSVRNWNKGKRDEYGHRKMFVYNGTENDPKKETTPVMQEEVAPQAAEVVVSDSDVISYEFFARKTCPNCPPVKAYLAGVSIPGTYVDVDSEEGLARAAELGVFAAPTVIMYNAAGEEVSRAHNAQELDAILHAAAVTC
ncbi:MAG: hypothetical protein KBT02_03100 [Treponema sp.]|nr:hypothetical protein [Candidatus Treponema caballi]